MVIILRGENALKTHPPVTNKGKKAEKKHSNQHMWSARQEATKTMWSEIDQITWSKYVVEAENHTSFLPPQVLYCNSSSSGCQGRFEIKPELKI